MIRNHALTAVLADGLVPGSEPPPIVVAERNDRRRTLVLSFNVWRAEQSDKEPPANPKGIMLLMLFDDGEGVAQTPTWERHTYALQPGWQRVLSAVTEPLPSSRVTAALSLPPGEEIGFYRVGLVVAEYSKTC